MRYIDENGNFIPEPDPSSGWGEETEIVIAHHEAEEEVPEVGHYEVIAEYPNGGKDVVWVIDIPGHPYIPAWDEYETVILWHFYPPEPEPEPEPPLVVYASKNHTKGSYFYIGEMAAWYEAIENIPANCKITNQNAREVSLEELFNSLKEQT